MKILIKGIEDHGEKFIQEIDKDFIPVFLKQLYQEAITPESNNTLQCDWIEMKLFALEQFACENDVSLQPSTDTVFKFVDKQLIITKALKKNPKESYSKFYNLVSAMNYGRVVQNKGYKVDMNWTYSEED